MTRARVRLMRPTERGAVRNLGAPFFEHLGGNRSALDGWLRHPAVVTVVAEGGRARPAGFALVGRLEVDGVAEAYLLAIGVAEDHRGQGLGRALLDTAIEQAALRARRWGVTTLRLDVEAANHAGQALFAGGGFEVVGPGEPYTGGQRSVRMERPLP